MKIPLMNYFSTYLHCIEEHFDLKKFQEILIREMEMENLWINSTL